MAFLKKMMMMIFNQQTSPNYALAQSVAYDTIYSSTQSKLPLSIKQIIKSIPNLHIQKYSKFAKKRKLSLEETYEILDSEEGCLWMRDDGQYIILYNDTVDNNGRIRFTIAHELGHYLLKHNEKSKKTSLSRYSLTNEEYDVFEKEANYFAKRLLAPIPLVNLYVNNWKKIYPQCIEYAFNTSFTVANYITNDLFKIRKNTSIASDSHPLIYKFIDYIRMDSCSKICKYCRTIQDSTNRYCVSCGAEKFTKSSAESYTTYFIERSKNVIYSKIETDENFTPLKCPTCNYEELDNQFFFCPYCATYIHNVCLGKNEDKYINTMDGIIELSIKERHIKNGCSKNILDGGYRYCPDCGSETSFFAQGLLRNWIDEQNQIDFSFNSKKFTELPFS